MNEIHVSDYIIFRFAYVLFNPNAIQEKISNHLKEEKRLTEITIKVP